MVLTHNIMILLPVEVFYRAVLTPFYPSMVLAWASTFEVGWPFAPIRPVCSSPAITVIAPLKVFVPVKVKTP